MFTHDPFEFLSNKHRYQICSVTNCIFISRRLLWKQVVELHKQWCLLTLRTAYFTPCKTSLGFVIYTPPTPFPGLLSLRDCCDGKKKIQKKSPSYFHAPHTNQFTFSQSISMFPSGCSKILPLIFFPEHSHFFFQHRKLCQVSTPCLGCLLSFPFVSTSIKACQTHPSYHSPNPRCDFPSLSFCIAERCWFRYVGWSAVRESLTRM